ncbi:MAG: DASH family cryptochrome [Bacteroidota bacterium]
MKRKRVIVWFRQDLRLHDNEALSHALSSAEEVIPVFVFDSRTFQGTTRFGFPKTGVHRAKFIIEAVQDLRQSLQAIGSDLYVRVGKPEDILFELAREVKTSWIFCNRERTYEEIKVQDALERNLWSIGQEIIYSRGKMLYYTQDLPFPVTHTPDVFTAFRKEVERFVGVREPFPSPKDGDFAPLTMELEMGQIPCLTEFGHSPTGSPTNAGMSFRGGETAGKERLHYYIWEGQHIQHYKDTRDELLGDNYSSKFSPWLAQGCLSPKYVYRELKKYESKNGASKSTYGLFFELLWRDFFRLMGKKHGNAIFKKGGIKGVADPRLQNDRHLLNLWKDGRTGVPFIDANMRELKRTGYMSSRGRQNVASFLVKDLRVNWQMGAEYFESLLVDYDPCSNWGNWNYIAGVGSDPRDDRYFNILKQAERYDPTGEYVKTWLPELQDIPAKRIHSIHLLSEDELSESQVRIGADYPRAMINVAKWE